MNKFTETERYSYEVYKALSSLFDEENENHAYDINKIDLTKFFTAVITGSAMFYKQITGDNNKDLFDYLALNTRLIHQHLSDKKEEK